MLLIHWFAGFSPCCSGSSNSLGCPSSNGWLSFSGFPDSPYSLGSPGSFLLFTWFSFSCSHGWLCPPRSPGSLGSTRLYGICASPTSFPGYFPSTAPPLSRGKSWERGWCFTWFKVVHLIDMMLTVCLVFSFVLVDLFQLVSLVSLRLLRSSSFVFLVKLRTSFSLFTCFNLVIPVLMSHLLYLFHLVYVVQSLHLAPLVNLAYLVYEVHLVLQVNIFNIISLSCRERMYEDINDRRSYIKNVDSCEIKSRFTWLIWFIWFSRVV